MTRDIAIQEASQEQRDSTLTCLKWVLNRALKAATSQISRFECYDIERSHDHDT